jgi:hypothetical protein
MGASAIVNGNPEVHTWIQATVAWQTGVLEATGMSKSNPNVTATYLQDLTGQAWLDSNGWTLTSLKGSGSTIWDFKTFSGIGGGYTNSQLCDFIANLGVAAGNYVPNVVTYNPLLGPNSNTFTAYMLSQAGLQIPALVQAYLALFAPGFFTSMPANP